MTVPKRYLWLFYVFAVCVAVSWLSVLQQRRALSLCTLCGLVFVYGQTSWRRGHREAMSLDGHIARDRPRSANGHFEMDLHKFGCDAIGHGIIWNLFDERVCVCECALSGVWYLLLKRHGYNRLTSFNTKRKPTTCSSAWTMHLERLYVALALVASQLYTCTIGTLYTVSPIANYTQPNSIPRDCETRCSHRSRCIVSSNVYNVPRVHVYSWLDTRASAT